MRAASEDDFLFITPYRSSAATIMLVQISSSEPRVSSLEAARPLGCLTKSERMLVSSRKRGTICQPAPQVNPEYRGSPLPADPRSSLAQKECGGEPVQESSGQPH